MERGRVHGLPRPGRRVRELLLRAPRRSAHTFTWAGCKGSESAQGDAPVSGVDRVVRGRVCAWGVVDRSDVTGSDSSLKKSEGRRCAWRRTSGCQCVRVCLFTSLIGGARFHACRYPVKPTDTAAKFDMQTHDHVVFVRKNKFFEVPLATPEGRELSAVELEVCVIVFVLGAALTWR